MKYLKAHLNKVTDILQRYITFCLYEKVEDGDEFESGEDGIGIIGAEGGLDGGDDAGEGVSLAGGLSRHRRRKPCIVEMHFLFVF